MTKYELMQKTEVDGRVWYYIVKNNDGFSVDGSWTQDLAEAEKMLEGFRQGKSSKPIIKVLKTIEVNED